MSINIIVLISCLGSLVAGFLIFWLANRNNLIKDIAKMKGESDKIIGTAKSKALKLFKDGEKKARQYKENQIKKVKEEVSLIKKDVDSKEKEVLSKEASLKEVQLEITKSEARLEVKEKNCDELEKKYLSKESELEIILEDAKTKIESISGLTREQARDELVSTVENEAKIISARKIKEIENDLHSDAERKAKNIIAMAIQKYAASYTSEKTSTVVELPSDDMKGRIIGREGRNIRTIELRTGVDIIIDDTPGIVTVSSHNPLRREIAGRAIKKLLDDGRVHPGRIEEIVEEIEAKLGEELQKLGQDAILELGLSNMHPELIRLVGRMKYRTSYSQNILDHSLEVAQLCGVLAGELGLDPKMAKRAGLLHDIGKAVDHDMEGSHDDIGADLVKKYNEPKEVIEAVELSHSDNPSNLYCLLVQASDAISAARPGARKESYESYVKRVKELEDIASSFNGVDKCFAIQAGREVRVMVESDKINDDEATILSHDIAKKIEDEVSYPGNVKITVVREVRTSAIAN
ncbi:ribonuclease Y [bacterium]|jgi:ribonucrease Y|nr:ribonuclease Y [bacterium]MBT3795405.1 ribonuclease Y [bacterium]